MLGGDGCTFQKSYNVLQHRLNTLNTHHSQSLFARTVGFTITGSKSTANGCILRFFERLCPSHTCPFETQQQCTKLSTKVEIKGLFTHPRSSSAPPILQRLQRSVQKGPVRRHPAWRRARTSPGCRMRLQHLPMDRLLNQLKY